ncbi:Membrane protein involved in the export of O-antigen and teichoic acid [Bryocella elongata]|uniref:Membrane protein involved in the export of O-antigen and teichoic acid n=1 Tax=Bryocella elongata TaxID=863522 RepID=A0A1H5UCJ4_9BACT|nr:oligosaccharide flippase family protein [Bryocella elongata]SEF72793.1 Membrane protein involved in the export of O-antigen and teichoic acid [Bryocella elongata]
MKIDEITARLRASTLARNAGWLLMGQGIGIVFQALNFVLLARLVGSREYGVYVGAFAFTSLFAPYSSIGMGSVFLRYVSGRPSEYARYFGNILVVSFVLSSMVTAALTVAAYHFLNPESARLVVYAAIGNCLFAQLALDVGRVFQTFEKMRVTATTNLVVNGLRTLAVAAMLLSIHHASALQWSIVSMLVSGIGAVSVVSLAIKNFGMPKVEFSLIRQRAVEGFGFSFAQSTSSVYNDVDKSMLSHYGMNQANGVYSMAYRVIDMASIPIYALRDASLPRFFEHGRKSVAHSADYGKRFLLRSIGLGAVTCVALFLLAPLLPMLAGKGFAQSMLALRWLAIIPVFRAIHQMQGSVLTSSGHQPLRTTAQLIAAGVNVVLNFLLIPRFNWWGAAWASIATDGLLAISTFALVSIVSERSRQKQLTNA